MSDRVLELLIHTPISSPSPVIPLSSPSPVQMCAIRELCWMMSATSHTVHTSNASSHTFLGTDVLVHPAPYSTVVLVVPLSSRGAHLPVGSLLQAPTLCLLPLQEQQ